jgi:type III secretion system FlhB-like substrate exporter
MLNRTNKSERIIEMNKQLSVQLQNEIDILQDKLSKLDNQFKIKNKHFSTVSFLFK